MEKPVCNVAKSGFSHCKVLRINAYICTRSKNKANFAATVGKSDMNEGDFIDSVKTCSACGGTGRRKREWYEHYFISSPCWECGGTGKHKNMDAEKRKMQYYIERSESGFVGNCLLWWRAGNHGYTCDLKDAQIFEEDDPKFLSAMDSGKYRAWEKEYIDRMATLHVDSEKLGFDMAYKIEAEKVKKENGDMQQSKKR